ncbi:MarR family winged helix-turn-helix transcriptional regulator [Actinophytocola sp.]|jgi:DNA-binding MarR family transcriptional regulator|uniref:MarR family winged helix-turn-helix transcriptional regulator n=1 Tax=Actinophytocola sp. TaxID=1872138 RepID=UPI002D429E79|nr:MarR family transcriptional regulator [Actinophytocola sp.]HYQ69678.1 MarR family transcriptional regulator [Actinophytocola sp.]
MTPAQRRAVAEQTRGAVARLARRLRAERPDDALSSNKIGVLSYLRRHGPSSPGEIAAAEHQQPQSLTRVYAELETAGFVRRSPNETDKRGAVLELTRAGNDMLRRDMAHRATWLADALEDLPDLEVEVLGLAAVIMDRLAER